MLEVYADRNDLGFLHRRQIISLMSSKLAERGMQLRFGRCNKHVTVVTSRATEQLSLAHLGESALRPQHPSHDLGVLATIRYILDVRTKKVTLRNVCRCNRNMR